MKHLTTILAAVLCAVCMSGCANSNAQTQQTPQIPRNHHCMSRIYFDDHYYIKYDTGGRMSSVSITHDPDCPCQNSRTLRQLLSDTVLLNQFHQASERAAAEATASTAEARRRAMGVSPKPTEGGEE